MTGAGLRRFTRNVGIVLILLLAVEFAAGLVLVEAARRYGQYLLDDDVDRVLDQALYVTESRVRSLDRIVGALAGSPWIVPAVREPSLVNRDHARSVLKRYCSAVEASVCYLMNDRGIVVASSNRDQSDSFEDQDYGFRPYFKAAMDGRAGFLLARGVTSGRRGYYTSYPVRDEDGRTIGAVVMKRNISDIERQLAGEFLFFIVDDRENILLSSRSDLADAADFPHANQTLASVLEPVTLVRGRRTAVVGGKRYYVYRRSAFLHGWSALVLAPVERLFVYRMSALAITGIVLLLTVVFAVLFLLNRMRRELAATREAGVAAAEQAQEAVISLAEKEVLLKEIHHRVKNNLQVISSLLSLQARYSNDERVRRILEESQMRIYSMAAIHEHLYRNQTLDGIDFASYVRALLDQIRTAIGGPAAWVRIETDIEKRILDIDQAIPCGLIVNELVSNAFKHAFPAERPGMVRVTFACDDGTGKGRMCVSDDGVGIPEANLASVQGLGLTLVNALVNQLGGKIEIDNSRGTRVCVEFFSKSRVTAQEERI